MLNRSKTAPPTAAELKGALHPLFGQLGSAGGLATLSAAAASLRLPRVTHVAALAVFLKAYRAQILLPLELPAICRAWHYASRNEVRELIALDQALAGQPIWQPFAVGSRRVGRSQLEQLQPLRDERVVRRYLQAVRQERAHAWHTLVYGLTLALYSLPVRQGLMSYARHTLHGFIQAAARSLQLRNGEPQQLLDKLSADLPRQLEAIVAAETASLRGTKRSS